MSNGQRSAQPCKDFGSHGAILHSEGRCALRNLPRVLERRLNRVHDPYINLFVFVALLTYADIRVLGSSLANYSGVCHSQALTSRVDTSSHSLGSAYLGMSASVLDLTVFARAGGRCSRASFRRARSLDQLLQQCRTKTIRVGS
jgi:hypothetical protein